ncbi:hypothetical protein F4678DRAFT_476789 [Xylaria arbuscula]|nr:hypothetical protein F4678DRAFT_476789 [Xylaria arbuscula]
MATLATKRAVTNSGARLRTIPGPYNCEVLAYPSTGGVVIARLLGVELEWLGIPPTSPALEQLPDDQDGEDAFALNLMRLGGRWWPSLKFEALHDSQYCPYGYHYPPDLHVAYLKQAVIVVKTFPAACNERLPEDAPRKPDDWSRLAACRTMEERWGVLKDFGATEYDDRKTCSDIPDSLEAGIAEGRRYEELLKKMQESEYRDRWLRSL